MRPWLKTPAGRDYLFGFQDLIDLYESAAESGLYNRAGLEHLAGQLHQQKLDRRILLQGQACYGHL